VTLDSVSSGDPLGFNVQLAQSATHYPMGFPLRIETNSADVLDAVSQFCSGWPNRNGHSQPVTVRIAVSDSESSAPGTPAIFSGQGHLVSVIQDPENFAIADISRSFAFARFTRNVARDAAHLRYHFLEPIVWLLLDAAHLAPLHASCVALHGCAVILCGDSGAGKTSLAYACARRGWNYLSDDATHVLRGREPVTVAGRPFHIRFRESARDLFPELNAFTAERRPNGKLDIEVATEKLNIPISLESAASHIVFLDRSSNIAEPRIRPYPRERASGMLRQLTCHGDGRVQAEQTRTLDRLLELPTVELTWHDFAGAEASLRALVKA
jgi:hypothetical protein